MTNEYNWQEAVELMRRGFRVRRRSEMRRVQVSDDVWESGQEGCHLAHAWTDEEKPTLVFRGNGSLQLFVPDSDNRNATDWVIVGRKDGDDDDE